MSTTRTPDTSREVSYRKRLIEIAHALNSANSIQDILVEVKDKILDLVDADRVTIFALDTKNQELFSLFKACLLYTSPSPRDRTRSRMPSSA